MAGVLLERLFHNENSPERREARNELERWIVDGISILYKGKWEWHVLLMVAIVWLKE